jgi:hypothetical protein
VQLQAYQLHDSITFDDSSQRAPFNKRIREEDDSNYLPPKKKPKFDGTKTNLLTEEKVYEIMENALKKHHNTNTSCIQTGLQSIKA